MAEPLRVVALGDSIVWGQGNREQDKFVGLVGEALRQYGYDVTVLSLAHSGAVVVPTKKDAEPGVWGEVPEAAPSIAYQLDGLSAPDTVDVLILDGGINDVSAFSIVVANPFDPDGLAALTAHTTRVFAGPMEQLVAKAAMTCPQATIVVTAYYPIISEATDVRMLVRLMKHLPRPIGTPNFFDWTAEHLPDDFLALAVAPERARMVEQSRTFAQLSTKLLTAAVAPYPGRAFVADPGFAPENAFAAPDTWLWTGVDDPLAAERTEKYAQHIVADPFDWPVYTPLASMCHPNTRGSLAYATAIEGCLQSAGRLS